MITPQEWERKCFEELHDVVSQSTIYEMARWYPLIDHPTQLALLTDNIRYKIVPAGRRSGKTERAKRFIAKTAMKNPGRMYFLAAPTYQQAEGIWWEDIKKLTFRSLQNKRPNESDLIVYLNNGAQIHVIGLDKPERIEGQPWSGGVIDEIANCKEDAWELNVKPALNTYNPTDPNYRAWCWLIGVPEGMNHYYKLWDYAKTKGLGYIGSGGVFTPGLEVSKDWKGYTWKSAEILPEDIIKAEMEGKDRKKFAQEYEASFETFTGRIYSDYGQNNWTNETIAPHEQLFWYHDFNYTPLSSGIGVRRIEKTGAKRDCILLLDEIILESAVARQSALEFVNKFKDHKNKRVVIFGDPSGRAGEKHGQQSNYTSIEDVLRDNGWTFERRVKASAPAIVDRQNAVRAKIANAAGHISLFVNPSKAPYTHQALQTVCFEKGSSFQEDEKNEYQHISTAFGYMIDYMWPVGSNMRKVEIAGN